MSARIVCDVCGSAFDQPGDFAAHCESEHILPPRQPFGHR
jgi:hypothetical protein